MPETIFNVAAGLATLASFQLSNLSLQKITYMSQLLYLGEEGQPLFEEDFEAWDYGPVCPELYHALKHHGSSPVSEKTIDKIADKPLMNDFTKRMRKITSVMTPGKLVAATHWRDGAWYKSYDPDMLGMRIPQKNILDEYNSLTERLKKDV